MEHKPPVIHLDFETYCDLNIKNVGAYKYTQHKSFDIICFAWAYNDEEIQLWEPSQDIPEQVLGYLADPNVLIAAWNAQFERCVINAKKKMFQLEKPIVPDRFLDVMAIATRLNYPRDLGKASAIICKGNEKDTRGKQLINKLCKPKKWSQSTPFTRWTPTLSPRDFKDFYDYCRQDVNVERDIFHRLGHQDLKPFEKKVWILTSKANQRGIRIDITLVKQIRSVLDEYTKNLTKRLIVHTGGQITTGGQRDRILEFCRQNGVTLPKLTEDIVLKAIKDESLPTKVRRVLWFRRKLSKTSTAKFNKMLESLCRDGTVKGNLIYAPTVTGRFAHVGLQIGNLPARVKFRDTVLADYRNESEINLIKRSIQAFQRGLPSVLDLTKDPQRLASLMIRPCLIPPEGYEWVVGDYVSVENKLLHWEVNDWDTIREFEEGLDQYKTFAADLYHKSYDKVTGDQRFHGKTAILGLGYMMGGKTYYETCKGYGLNITLQECERTVKLYRDKYKLVNQGWFQMYRAAKEAVELGHTTKWNRILFKVQNDRLLMRLATGRCVAYNSPKIEWKEMPWKEKKKVITFMGLNPYTHKWARMQITPGRLMENLIQADSREVLVRGKVNLEEKKYFVLGSLHDEILTVRKKGQGSVEEFNELMCNMGPWAKGLPLTATSWIGERYRKE